MISISTGLRKHLMGTGSLKAALDGAYVKLYSGTPPSNADAAFDENGGALITTITLGADGATGLVFNVSNEFLIKPQAGTTWGGLAGVAGTYTFFRISHLADADGDDSGTQTEIRVQGSVGVIGGTDDLVMAPDQITVSTNVPTYINYLSLTL